QALTVYADLAKAMKDGLKQEATAMASAAALRDPAFFQDEGRRREALAAMGKGHARAAMLSVERCSGELAGAWTRPVAMEARGERAFSVRALLRRGADPALLEPDSEEPACGEDGLPLRFTATFAVPRARFDELEDATVFAQAYHQVERDHREEYLAAPYRNALVVLLVVTMVIGVAVALLVAQPVT